MLPSMLGSIGILMVISTASPDQFGDRWLIILSSSKALGVRPKGLTKLETSDVPHSVVRLSSTEFKGLMPCYEVVVANAFSSRRKAIAYSKRLTKMGIDNYPKNAGRYVGRQPRVEAFCRGEQAPSACRGAVRLPVTMEGSTYVDLALDSVVSERLLARATAPRSLSSNEWVGTLEVKTIGDHSIGQAFTVHGKGGATGCKVSRFVAVTRGQAHFSYEASGAKGPGCGTPKVFAQLDCAVEAPTLAAPSSAQQPVWFERFDVDLPTAAAARAVLDDSGVYGKLHSEALATAKSQKEKLLESLAYVGFRAKGRKLVLVDARYQTRDGVDMCGNEDVNLHVSGLVEIKDGGAELLRPFWRNEGDVLGVFSRDGRTIDVLQKEWFETRSIVGRDGARTCSLTYDYCDCPC